MQINFPKRASFASFLTPFIPAFFILFSLCPTSNLAAQGDLFIAPKRVVFEGRERYKELNLSNTGKDTARYEISFIHYRMKEGGNLEELKTVDSSFQLADPFVRFFPRTVTLAPGESQAVRLQLTQMNNLENGEYRSHLYFRSVPNPNAAEKSETKKADSSSISIKLNPVFGIAVPVLIHVGESTTKINLFNCSFQKTEAPFVKMTLQREGNMSFYGDISVDHISPEGTVTRVAEQKGIAVYMPNELRQVKLAVNKTLGVDYTKGKLHVVYKAQENLNPNSIAQTEVYLN